MSGSNLEGDIAYMKSLAEDGGKGPLRNGGSLFLAGLVYGLASIAHYAMIEGYLQKSTATAVIIWFGASLAFGLLSFFFGFSGSRARGSVGNQAARSAWTGVVMGILAMVACVAVIAYGQHDLGLMSYIVAPVVFILYGVGWWVSALMSGTGWLKIVSIGCFVGAVVISLLAGQSEQFLANAACLFLLAMVPGLLLMRAAKG